MCNEEIRRYAKRKYVPNWQIAAALNISESTFSRRLRVEMNEEEKKKVMDIIANIADAR